MSLIRFIPSWVVPWAVFLFRYQRPVTRIALQSSKLSKLPPELYLVIASFLPLEAAVALSLSCRPIYYITGPRHLEALKEETNSDHRSRLLALVERDLHDHVLCSYCHKFHAINKAHKHVRSGEYLCPYDKYLPCWKADHDYFVAHYIHPKFSSTIFQMAIKRHRQGLDPSKLLALISCPTRPWFPIHNREDCTVSARIIDGSLLMRHQKVFKPLNPPNPWNIDICPHIQFWPNDKKSSIRWRSSPNHRHGDELVQCRYCVTEFYIGFSPCGAKVSITKWFNLGYSSSSKSWEWQSHLSTPLAARRLPIRFELGSVCMKFEEKRLSEFNFENILWP